MWHRRAHDHAHGPGLDVVGVGYAPSAIEFARRNAGAKGVDARFEVADAMNLGDPGYDTIVDSALFHFSTREPGALCAQPARSLRRGRGRPPAGTVRPRTRFRAGGQRIRHLRRLGDGWVLEALDSTTYRGVIGESHVETFGKPAGSLVDEPAWFAHVRRVSDSDLWSLTGAHRRCDSTSRYWSAYPGVRRAERSPPRCVRG